MNDHLPSTPPRLSADQEAATVALLAAVGLIPGGSALAPFVEAAVTRGRTALMEQFHDEVARTLRRHEQRIGHLDFQVFMARKEAAAALNSALGIAGKTSSIEKHRLLANALVNGAAADPEVEPLLPMFWTLVEQHSALDVRLLHFMSNPVNLATRAGYEFDQDPIQGECLFHVIPEMRYGTVVRNEHGEPELQDDEHDEDDEDDEDPDEPEHDVTVAPGPYLLLWNSMHRLHADRLIDISHAAADVDTFLEEFDVTVLGIESDEPRHPDGTYLGHPFESLTELGARYLAFVSAPGDID